MVTQTPTEQLVEEYFERNTFYANNEDAKGLFKWMAMPEQINKMVSAVSIGLPPLAGIIREIEDRFAYAPNFPLYTDDNNNYYKHRQVLGKWIKAILDSVGYIPDVGEGAPSNHLPRYTGVKSFSTSTPYKKSDKQVRFKLKPPEWAEK